MSTVTSAISEVAEIFDGRGAFIYVQRQGRASPAFDIVAASEVRTFGTPYHRRPTTGIFLVMDDFNGNDSLLARTIRTIAFDTQVVTVYTESVQLAQYLASEASRLCEVHPISGTS
ncbi:hypothetical protein C8R48DRAFT_781316 [Suillus tomentosus]|nr:hypothetical protein C8R48DRAFT_781316 [Suillus tomentosus]